MCEEEPRVQTQEKLEGACEPKSIIFIGGPWNTKHFADRGDATRILKDKSFVEHLYKRDTLELRRDNVIVCIEIFAYFGKLEDQCIE